MTTGPAGTLDLPLRTEPAPITVRDPFLEFLGLVGPGEPVHVTFTEIVKVAGHACPTVAGAYLVLKYGLAVLYGSEPAVRGAVRVTAYGSPTDFGYGPMAQVINQVIGAAPETGFAGMAGGRFRRRGLFVFRRDDVRRNEFDLERLDTAQAVHVAYDPSALPTSREFSEAIAPALSDRAGPQAIDHRRQVWLGRVDDIL